MQTRLAVAEGRLNTAVEFGDRFVNAAEPSIVPTSDRVAIQSYADALVRLGRVPRAISLLETNAAKFGFSYGSNYAWMRSRAQLAELYRRVGRTDDADKIDLQLLNLLSVADADFPLLVRLRQPFRSRRSN
jgi:hypothetical protein